MRKVVGVAAATVTATFASAVFIVCDNFLKPILSSGWIPAATWGTVWSTIEFQSIIVIPIALVVSLLGGVPLGNRLATRGRAQPREFLGLGAILGAIPIVLMELLELAGAITHAFGRMMGNGTGAIAAGTRFPAFGWGFVAHWLIEGAWCGACSALAYWFIVYRGSPSNFALQRSHSRVTPRAEHGPRRAAGR